MRRREFLASSLLALPMGCAVVRGPGPAPLRIATFKADVTPPLGAPLCHGSVQPAKRIDDPLTARGIILLPGDQPPIVLCSVEWVAIANAAHDAFREALARAVGAPVGRVSVHAIHNHSAPGIDFSTEQILVAHGLSGRMFDPAAAHKAIADTAKAAAEAVNAPRRVTHLGTGMGRVDKVASNRRILAPSGKCIMTRMSSCRSPKAIAAPEGIIDPYVRMLSFWDGDRPLAVLMYYATHPMSYYGRGGVSCDFAGIARAMREKAVPGAFHIYFNGAGGDIAAGKYNDGSKKMRPILAARMAKGMKAAWDSQARVPICADDVGWTVYPVALPVRDILLKDKLLAKVKDTKRSTRDRVRRARELAWVRRMQSGHRIELTCLRLGPARVLHMPGELCIEYQLAAQQMRPDAFVCLAAYADDGMAYICMKKAYAQGGYEPSRVSRVAPEVEDVLMPAMRRLLAVPQP